MADYYKYANPQKHLDYYIKHFYYLNRAIQSPSRLQWRENSQLQFLNAAPETELIDIYVNNRPVVQRLAFGKLSKTLAVPYGNYYIDIYPSGDSTTSIFSKKITIKSGNYLIGATGMNKKLQLLPYDLQVKTAKNEASVRFLHLSPDAPAIDVTVPHGDIVFPDLSYKELSEPLAITPMTLNFILKVAGSKNHIFSLPKFKTNPQKSYTIILIGCIQHHELPSFKIVILEK